MKRQGVRFQPRMTAIHHHRPLSGPSCHIWSWSTQGSNWPMHNSPRVASLKSGSGVPMGGSTVFGSLGAVRLPIPSGDGSPGHSTAHSHAPAHPAGPSNQRRGRIHHKHHAPPPTDLSQGIVKNALLINGLIRRCACRIAGSVRVKAIKLMWPLAASVMAGHKLLTAVPDVVTTNTGRLVALAMPRPCTPRHAHPQRALALHGSAAASAPTGWTLTRPPSSRPVPLALLFGQARHQWWWGS